MICLLCNEHLAYVLGMEEENIGVAIGHLSTEHTLAEVVTFLAMITVNREDKIHAN